MFPSSFLFASCDDQAAPPHTHTSYNTPSPHHSNQFQTLKPKYDTLLITTDQTMVAIVKSLPTDKVVGLNNSLQAPGKDLYWEFPAITHMGRPTTYFSFFIFGLVHIVKKDGNWLISLWSQARAYYHIDKKIRTEHLKNNTTVVLHYIYLIYGRLLLHFPPPVHIILFYNLDKHRTKSMW